MNFHFPRKKSKAECLCSSEVMEAMTLLMITGIKQSKKRLKSVAYLGHKHGPSVPCVGRDITNQRSTLPSVILIKE